MSMARHELVVGSTKVLEQLNYLRLVMVVSKACHPRADTTNSGIGLNLYIATSINDG